MPDIFTKRKRSDVMSRIRSSGNQATELRLIQIFRAHGITGWRRGCALRSGPGVQGPAPGVLNLKPKNPKPKSQTQCRAARIRPDFVFPKLKTAVFVDGCFWHGCPRHATWPKTRAAFWKAKIEANQARDRRVNRALRKRGWVVIRIWEHELKRRDEQKLVRRLVRALGQSA